MKEVTEMKKNFKNLSVGIQITTETQKVRNNDYRFYIPDIYKKNITLSFQKLLLTPFFALYISIFCSITLVLSSRAIRHSSY